MFNLNNGLLSHLINNGTVEEGGSLHTALLFTFVAVTIVVAYLLGSINSAVLISRTLYKDDIRNHGSGNGGMTNMLRTFGLKAAGLTLLGDMLKTVLAITVAGVLLGFNYGGGISYNDGYCYIAGLFAVMGHVFPIYYGFKGGKGVLVTATMALMLTPVPFLILLAIFALVVWLSRYVSLGSVCGAVLYPVVVTSYIKLFGAPVPGLISLCTIIIAIFVVWCHRENLVRISNRTERKLSFKKKDVEVQKVAVDNEAKASLTAAADDEVADIENEAEASLASADDEAVDTENEAADNGESLDEGDDE